MALELEYHSGVRRGILFSVALAGLLWMQLAAPSRAQTNGVPASVTSPGFGGRAINGTAPSVTSVGRQGSAPGPVFLGPGNGSGSTHPHHPHHHYVGYAPPTIYALPVPYAVDIGDSDDDQDDDADYQGGPTVFDRRGHGAASYVPPVEDAPPPHGYADQPAAPDPPQAPTVLVFKDGRKQDVQNYAIIGDNFFDLTPGHSRKIALADLDLDATRKVNDDHGVTFQLPPSAQAN